MAVKTLVVLVVITIISQTIGLSVPVFRSPNLAERPWSIWNRERSQSPVSDNSGYPYIRLGSPQNERILLPVPSKKGGKVFVLDVLDYVTKEKGEGEDGVPAVAVSAKSDGTVKGNMMRFSGK